MNDAPSIPQPRQGQPPSLRDYQRDAITAAQKAWQAGRQRVGIVLPTGAGKTVTFAQLIAEQGTRTLVLAHREELIDQAEKTLRARCPGKSVGIVQGPRDFPTADIVIGSVQTVIRDKRRNAIGDIGLVVVDEAHHAYAGTYRDILEHFGCWRDGGAKAFGVTATMARTNDTEALGDVWEDVVYQLDILDLIDAGHLCDVRGVSITLPGLNLDGVRSRGGDYQAGALAAEMDAAEAWTAAADAYVAHAGDRPGVIFTPTVAAAHQTAAMLNERGVKAEAVDGDSGVNERGGALARYRSGDTQVLVNCSVFTEGFDAPWTAAVLIARPTKSDILYVQMAGRALRTHPGKDDALVIDLVGLAERKKLATLACLTGREVGEIPEGESLREAVEREHTARQTINQTALYLGELAAADVDLFDRDNGVIWPDWNGVRYIDVGGKPPRTIYISPRPTADGRFDVIGRVRGEDGEKLLAQDLTFRRALGRAEKEARALGAQLVRRNAPWRDAEPTPGQITTLRQMHVEHDDEITRGEASELISRTAVGRDFRRRPPRGYVSEPAR